MNIQPPVRLAILDMNNNVENMGIASIKRIADRFAIIDYDVFDVRYKGEVPGMDYDLYISSGGPGDPLEGDGIWDTAYFDLMDSLWQHNQVEADKKYVFFCAGGLRSAHPQTKEKAGRTPLKDIKLMKDDAVGVLKNAAAVKAHYVKLFHV